MEEDKSGDSRTGRLIGRVTSPLTSATGAITGRAVEDEIEEFGETFTQVALGLHRDVTALQRRVAILEQSARNTEQLAAADESSRSNRAIFAVSALAVIAMGVAIWALISG
jgi:hypothetical protein